MATDTLTTLDKLTKDQFFPGLQNWINKQRPIFARIEKITDKKRFVGGRQIVIAAQESDAQSTGAIAEDELLPAAQGPGIVNMTIAMRYHYGAARLSAQAMEIGKSDAAGFADAVDTVTSSVKNQLKEDLAISALYGDGYGAIGQVSAYSSTTLTLYTQPTVGKFGTRPIRKTMFLQSWAGKTGGSVAADHKQVSAVSSNGSSCTVPSSAGFVADDYVFRSVNAGVDPRDKVIMGLGGIVDDGTRRATFQNLSRTTYPSLQARVLGNSGTLRPWTPDLMDSLGMETYNNGGGMPPTAYYSEYEIQQRASAYLRQDRMFDGKMKTYDGGYAGVAWTSPEGEAPWFYDKFCIPNEVHAVYEPDLFFAIWKSVEECDNDGRSWRYTDRRDSPELWVRFWGNIGARACNNMAALKEVSHTA